MANKLVAFFSASGTTARTAKELAGAIGADLFEIEPVQPYSSADLNWRNKASRSSVEMNDDSCRPAIANTIANLDGYLETQSRQFLVEAKCREPYGHGAAVSVSEKYRTYYEHLNRSCPGGLSCEMQTEKDGRMRVEYRLHGHPISGFDMKQMLCHLLGAATGLLEGTLPPKPIEFLYLLYDPSFLPLQEREKERIMAAYHRHCLEAAAVDFEAVFACTLDFLAGKPVEREYVFRFTPCDQRQYAALLRTAGDN